MGQYTPSSQVARNTGLLEPETSGSLLFLQRRVRNVATTAEPLTIGGFNFSMSEELRSLQQTVREYVRTRLEPISQQVEHEDRIPDEIVREMGELGLFGVPFPERYGGLELGELGYCLALEELGAVNAAYANLIGATVGLFGNAVNLDGTEEQKE